MALKLAGWFAETWLRLLFPHVGKVLWFEFWAGGRIYSKYFDASRFLGVVVGQLLFQVHLWIAVRQVQLLCVHWLL